MKRPILTFIFLVLTVFAVSASVCSAGSIADEYLRLSDELRVRAATETDAARRDEMLVQADEYERMAEEHSAPEPDSIFEDPEETDAASAMRARERLDKMRRDYDRDVKVQDRIEEDASQRICASCEE